MHLIVGLGNPGESGGAGSGSAGEYEGTRHNIGREIVQSLAEDWRTQKKLFAEIAKGDHVLFALPTTYMNDSGRSVKTLLTTYNLQLENILIVHDDLDLPLGTLRFSHGANAGGQKGVQSIIDTLGTNDFARLRIGVAGAHRTTTDAAEYVLKKFSREEKKTVHHLKERAQQAIADYCAKGLAEAMNQYNRKK